MFFGTPMLFDYVSRLRVAVFASRFPSYPGV